MDLIKIIKDLRQELSQMEQAIISLERLTMARGKRRGRPTKWMVEAQKALGDEKAPAKRKTPKPKPE